MINIIIVNTYYLLIHISIIIRIPSSNNEKTAYRLYYIDEAYIPI